MSLTAAVSPLLAPLRGTSWSGSVLATGRFGATMRVASVNDGPFTVLLDL